MRHFDSLGDAGRRNCEEIAVELCSTAGVILSLPRQDEPDISGYNDPEVVYRIKKHHHAGLILRSQDQGRVQGLLENYAERFAVEFMAVQPQKDKPTA